MRVRFRDFWPGFDPTAYFIPLLESAPFNFHVELVNSGDAQVEIHSVFPSRWERAGAFGHRLLRALTGKSRTFNEAPPRNGSGPLRIWFTGENVRPPLGRWDATLSFDSDSPRALNAYFPLWWQLFPELLGNNPDARPGIVPVSRFLPLDSYLDPRVGSAHTRDKFACAVISNPEPTRMRAIELLRNLGQVDIFGRVSGRPVSDKHQVFSQYRFVICFENGIFPGYVTEKLFDAWGAGAIPIWWGLDHGNYINPRSILNLAEEINWDSLLHRVEDLDKSPGKLEHMSSEALLSRRPTLDGVRSILAKALLEFEKNERFW